MGRRSAAFSVLNQEKQPYNDKQIREVWVDYSQRLRKCRHKQPYGHAEYKENYRFRVHNDLRIEIVQGGIYSFLCLG